jgi:hypothetical protein
MTKETLVHKADLEPLAVGLAGTFIQRWDLYARQFRDGSYVCFHQPLEITHLVSHLKGEITLGAYVLNPSSQARYIVFDADNDVQLSMLAYMAGRLAEQDAPSYLESSRRGGHLWLFFSRAIPGKDARLFGQSLLKIHNLLGVELFPKQSRLKGGPGSLIRLPFGIHRKTGERYGFVTPERQPLAPAFLAQINILSAPETVPEVFIKKIMTRPPATQPAPVLDGMETLKKPLSERVKDSISVRDFVSQYVELSPAGRGLCPFHNDQHASFSVNAEGNYWHCFAGCGGGSIIDFWMKWQSCDFTEAIYELANLLLPPAQKAKEPERNPAL